MEEWERASEKGRIQRYAESFRRLAEAFAYLPSRKEELSGEDIEGIYEAVKGRVCRECGKRADCWGKYLEKTTRLIYGLLAQLGGEEADEETPARIAFCRHCMKGNTFAKELEHSFCQSRIDLMWSNRMLENRSAMAEQLQETAQIIEEIACTVFDAGEADSLLARRLRQKLRLQNVRVQDLRMVRSSGGYPEMIVTARAGRGRCVPVKTVAQALSQVCGQPFVPERDSRLTLGQEQSTLHFVKETRYYMLTGAAKETCAGEAASGDHFSVLTGSHGQVILGICDGMGSGLQAGRESQTVIELLEQFLNAGFAAETAVRMINSAMVLQSGMQRFLTLDICGINLYNGQCELLKVGASATFIRRAGWVEAVLSTSLPAGIFREVDFERTRKKLEHGDMLIMMSDGVLDALPGENKEELMKYLIGQISTDNPSELARILLEEVLSFEDHIPRDDMTILAGGFWKK